MNAIKRILNVLLIVFGVLLIAACADLMTNKLVSADFESLNETDRSAIEELCEMTALFDDKYGCEDVWNSSYNLRDEACVITRRYGMLKGYTYAVNMTAPKSIFAQRIEMPDDYSDIPVYRFAYLTPFTFSLAKMEEGEFTEVEGKRVFASVFDAQNVKYNGSGSLEESYIKNTFADSVESVDVPTIDENIHFDIDEENVALFGLQYRIIDDMLSARTTEELNELIAEFVVVREYQSEKYPEFADKREQIELKYGCPQYAFYNISDKIDHDITYFNKEKSDAITFYSAYYYLCTGRYNSNIEEFLDVQGNEYAGAALCSIISGSGLRSNWESRLCGDPENFTSPYTIIKNYCGGTCSEFSDKTIDDIKRTYNYEEIISMARTLVSGIDGE